MPIRQVTIADAVAEELRKRLDLNLRVEHPAADVLPDNLWQTDTTACSEHEHRLAGFHLRASREREPCREVALHERGTLTVGQFVGDGQHPVRHRDHLGRESALGSSA